MGWLVAGLVALIALAGAFYFLYSRWSRLNEAGLREKREEAARLVVEEAKRKLEEEQARQRAEERRTDVTEASKAANGDGAGEFLRNSWGKDDGQTN